MSTLIEDIKNKLGIKSGSFIDAEIQDHVNNIDKSMYFEFFKELTHEMSLPENKFAKPMVILAKAADKFKPEDEVEKLLDKAHEDAKKMYDRFYYEHGKMTDYAAEHRNTYPEDKDFFLAIDYSSLRREDGSSAYSEQELYVLKKLGGGEWHYNMKNNQTSSVVIQQIYDVIRDGIKMKYGKTKHLHHTVNKSVEHKTVDIKSLAESKRVKD